MSLLARLPIALLLAVPWAAGCGATPDAIDPTGVDQLTVPTPQPDPDDFVQAVDNPWLGLADGRTWTYRVSGDEAVTTGRIAVLDQPRTILGVPVTGLRTEEGRAGRAPVRVVERWLAQDEAGNVWLLGQLVEEYAAGRRTQHRWQAGDHGAEAGLFLPAEPRVGDGWRTAHVPGEQPQVRTVLEVGGTLVVAYGELGDVVGIRETDPSGETAELAFARDVGLAAWDAGAVEAELVDVTD